MASSQFTQIPLRDETTNELKEKQSSLTKPGLLISLHLDGKAKISQLHCRSLHLTGQQQVLWLQEDT